MMGHDVQDTIKNYGSTNKLHCILFHSKVMKSYQFMHVMKMPGFEIIKIYLTDQILNMTGCGKSEEFSTT